MSFHTVPSNVTVIAEAAVPVTGVLTVGVTGTDGTVLVNGFVPVTMVEAFVTETAAVGAS